MAHIFIVDDNPNFRAHLRGLLESVAEWEICGEAHDGKEAVEKHSSIRPHITVMDFNMPELNGLHASRAILRNCPDAPILLLTIFASPSWQSKPNDTVGIAQEMILVGRQKVKQPSS